MAGPTVAERVRSVITTADSLRLTLDGFGCDLVGLHDVSDSGRIALRVPADSALAARVVCAPDGDLAAVLDFTDVAPTAVRDRVRARVALSGWLAPAERQGEEDVVLLDFDLAMAVLSTASVEVELDPEDLEGVAPDPLAAVEASLLLHLADAHADLVGTLTALCGPRARRGVARVVPVALDARGLVLRLERSRTYEDVRLPFARAARDRASAAEAIRELVAEAQAACARRR
ncbi:DUF2470 domain-containing protein [Streptomyces sp. NPDC051940]|uniref:DUF2470 domain-containing protein n=1 Tax=Streptomyces sp. NPDC051940 TaxID=3155675 RepID=UPI00341D1E75